MWQLLLNSSRSSILQHNPDHFLSQKNLNHISLFSVFFSLSLSVLRFLRLLKQGTQGLIAKHLLHPYDQTSKAELGLFFFLLQLYDLLKSFNACIIRSEDQINSTTEWDLFCVTVLHGQCERLWHKADVRFFFSSSSSSVKSLFVPEGGKLHTDEFVWDVDEKCITLWRKHPFRNRNTHTHIHTQTYTYKYTLQISLHCKKLPFSLPWGKNPDK